jgi:hypothetical protein
MIIFPELILNQISFVIIVKTSNAQKENNLDRNPCDESA